MDIDRLFQSIAEIAGERFGTLVKVKEVRYENAVLRVDDSESSYDMSGEPYERR